MNSVRCGLTSFENAIRFGDPDIHHQVVRRRSIVLPLPFQV